MGPTAKEIAEVVINDALNHIREEYDYTPHEATTDDGRVVNCDHELAGRWSAHGAVKLKCAIAEIGDGKRRAVVNRLLRKALTDACWNLYGHHDYHCISLSHEQAIALLATAQSVVAHAEWK